VAGRTHRSFPHREDRPQGGGYSAFGAKKDGEDVIRTMSASPRLIKIALETTRSTFD